MVTELIHELKKQGLGIFLIDHDIHSVMQDLRPRRRHEKRQGGRDREGRSGDRGRLLGMIILGKCPPGAIPGPGAINPEIAAA
jgi:D-xylose transport system ATP-binding protein